MKNQIEIVKDIADGMIGIGGVPTNEEFYAEFDFRLRAVLGLGAVSGSLLLLDLFQVAAIKNEDGMPVIKYVDKPNGGSVAYVRHDAMVNKLNALLKQ